MDETISNHVINM